MEIFEFLKRPRAFVTVRNDTFISRIKEFFLTVILMYLTLFIITFFLKCIDYCLNYYFDFSFYKTINSQQLKSFKNFSFFYIVLIAPLIEEIIFRLPLSLKKEHIIISLSLLTTIFFGGNVAKWGQIEIIVFFKIIFFILLIIYIFYKINLSHLTNIKENYFKYFFYVLTIFFGLLHVTNFLKYIPNNFKLLSILFIIPQIVLAFFSGYMRIKNGFFWSVLMHIIFNLPSAIMLYLKYKY